MSSKTKKLGALADIYQSEHLDGSITRLRLDKIRPSADQPRADRTFAVDELAKSIKKDGLLSPIIVTKDGNNYRIIAGERRYHALRKLNWSDAECRIISREERDYWRIAIVENLQRENLSATEEAIALLRLKKQDDLSDSSLAELVGKSRNYITEILSVAQLPEAALKKCQSAGISNKNFLIQAAQAHKKGHLDAFVELFKSGEMKTVRQAKDYNQGRPTSIEDGSINTSPAVSAEQDLKSASIALKKNIITIECADSQSARTLKRKIQKLLTEIN